MYSRIKTPEELRDLIKSGRTSFYLTSCDGTLDKSSKCVVAIDPGDSKLFVLKNERGWFGSLTFTYMFNNTTDKMRLFTNFWGAKAFDLKHRHSERNKEPA